MRWFVGGEVKCRRMFWWGSKNLMNWNKRGELAMVSVRLLGLGMGTCGEVYSSLTEM